jgi:hypothetical protein
MPATTAVDFTKFPYSPVANPAAATRTEAITAEPVASGFVVMALKAAQPDAMLAVIRDFARSLRAKSSTSGLTDLTAYRQLRRGELGGAMPFDQPICEALLTGARAREQSRRAAAEVEALVLGNPHADWVVLLEYDTPDTAAKAVRALRDGADDSMGILAPVLHESSIGAFRNTMQYASVSRDPKLIQFFNLFPSPGNRDVLWPAWQEALPWFFEIAEFRSSFPLLALDPEQALLLINYAHTDSTKHFINGTLYDPSFMESMKTCYFDRDVAAPHPFFCKIVPV